MDIAELALRVDALEVKQANSELSKLAKTSASTDKSVKDLASSVQRSFAIMKTGAAALATAFGAIQSFRILTDAAIQMDRFNSALIVGTGSAQKAAKEMQFVRDTANELGLNLVSTAEQYSKLSAAAAGTALQGQATRDIFEGIAQASTVLGLSADEAGGALTAIQQIISKGKVSAEELRGQLGERLPGAFQIAARSIGVTTQELDKMLTSGSLLAEDLLPQFSEELKRTFGPQSVVAAQNLNAQLNRMETAFFDLKVAIGETGIVDFFKDAIVWSTEFLNVLTGSITTTKKTAIEKQIELIDALEERVKELQGQGSFFGWIKSGLVDNTRELHAAEQALEDAYEDLERLQEAAQAVGAAIIPLPKPLREVAEEVDNIGTNSKKTSDGLDKFRRKVFDLTQQYDPLARLNHELEELLLLRDQFGLRDDIFDAAATQAVLDFQEAIEETNEEIKKVDQSTKDLGDTGQRVFQDISQFALQGARNIQNALADSLYNSIGDFENFAKDVLDIIKRMAANIASVKILEGLGLEVLFGGSGSSGSLFGGGGSGAGFNLLNGASLLSNTASLFNSGFGLTSALGTGLQFAGSLAGSGSTAAFGAGLAGDGIGGIIAGTEAGLTGSAAASAASAGAAAASSVATLGAAAVGTFIGKAIAGDKEIFGASGTVTASAGAAAGAAVGSFFPGLGTAIGAGVGAIIGGLTNRLFGRGPQKRGRTLIRGNLTEEGIADDFLTSTSFRSKGGTFRSSKTDRVINSAVTGELLVGAPGLPESGIDKSLMAFAEESGRWAQEIGEFFSGAVQQFDTSLRQVGENLGIGSDQLDNFQRWIHLVSDEAGNISDEAIAAEIKNIGDHMANVLLPGLEAMRRGNETTMQTLDRLVKESAALESALTILGVSTKEAEAAVRGLSIAQRTELVDAAGGLDAFAAQFTFFADNFLTLEQQLEVSFNALDAKMQEMGFSADMTREEFADLIRSVTKVGGISVETAAELLALAPAFDHVKNQQAELAAENERLANSANNASSSVDGLTGSINGLDDKAQEVANAVQASFAQIDQARADVVAAQNNLAVARAKRDLSDANKALAIADQAVADAQADLSRARSFAQQQAQQQQSDAIAAINATIEGRSELIQLYEKEAGALRSTVDRFDALSDKIVQFRNALALSDLSPFSPGEQLGIARQQFNQTRNLAAQGDEDALARLPQVSQDFLEASKTFNGATAAFESDFQLVQAVLDSAGVTARQAKNIAADQLLAAENAVSLLESQNESSQQQIKALQSISLGFDDLNEGVLSVEEATANLKKAQDDQLIAQQQVRDKTRDVEAALFTQNGYIDDVGKATIEVRDAVEALTFAVLQGFGNAAISDKQIVDFVLANQDKPDSFFVDKAIEVGLSGNQLKGALNPIGVSSERINLATHGGALRNSDIASVVDQKLAEGDFMGIYDAAKANGVDTERLAAASVLSVEEIENFARMMGLPRLDTGTDFVKKGGLAMLHPAETVGPASAPRELKEEVIKLREELAQLRRDQNRQMEALINTNIAANQETAKAVTKSAKQSIKDANWLNRSRPKVA